MEEKLKQLCENNELELAFELIEALDIGYVEFDVDKILNRLGEKEELPIKNVKNVLIDIYRDDHNYDVRFCYNDPTCNYNRIEYYDLVRKCKEVTNISDFYHNNYKYRSGLSKNELCKLIFNYYGKE